jgi:hypothetical protein
MARSGEGSIEGRGGYGRMSFNYYARKVRNPRLPLKVRCSSLASCLLRLAWLTQRPYLATRSRFAAHLPADGAIRLNEERLLAAMAMVEVDRNRFLERLRSFERKRIREKLRGRRSPRPTDVAVLYETTQVGGPVAP